MKKDKERLQARIAEWVLQVQRDSGGISLRELAKRAGIPSTTITGAARGEAGAGLHLALYRLAKVWPAGSYLDATKAWFGEEEQTDRPSPSIPARRNLDEDAEVAINASLDQMRATISAIQGLMDRVAEVSTHLQEAVGSLETKRLADIERRLEHLDLENRSLKARLGLSVDRDPEEVDVSPEALQQKLQKLKATRKPKSGNVSSPKLESSQE